MHLRSAGRNPRALLNQHSMIWRCKCVMHACVGGQILRMACSAASPATCTPSIGSMNIQHGCTWHKATAIAPSLPVYSPAVTCTQYSQPGAQHPLALTTHTRCRRHGCGPSSRSTATAACWRCSSAAASTRRCSSTTPSGRSCWSGCPPSTSPLAGRGQATHPPLQQQRWRRPLHPLRQPRGRPTTCWAWICWAAWRPRRPRPLRRQSMPWTSCWAAPLGRRWTSLLLLLLPPQGLRTCWTCWVAACRWQHLLLRRPPPWCVAAPPCLQLAISRASVLVCLSPPGLSTSPWLRCFHLDTHVTRTSCNSKCSEHPLPAQTLHCFAAVLAAISVAMHCKPSLPQPSFFLLASTYPKAMCG
jgi:hypothetical protein